MKQVIILDEEVRQFALARCQGDLVLAGRLMNVRPSKTTMDYIVLIKRLEAALKDAKKYSDA